MVKSSNILHKYTFTYQTYRILQSFIIGVTRNTGRPSMYTYTLQWPYAKCSGVCISGVAHCIRMKISFGILLLYRSSHATVTSWEHQNNKNLNPLKTFVWVIFLISFEKWNDFEFEFKQCMLYGHLIKSVCGYFNNCLKAVILKIDTRTEKYLLWIKKPSIVQIIIL